MTNEIQNSEVIANENVNKETGEIIGKEEQVIEETNNYVTVKLSDGTYKRRAKYHDYSSFKPETREEKMWLLNLIDADESTGKGLSTNVGKKIEVQDIITRTYSNLDEKTGETINGVLTYLITPDQEAYVTSSKGVYFTIKNIMELFGTPEDEDWENITVEVGSERTQNGTAIKVKMIG